MSVLTSPARCVAALAACILSFGVVAQTAWGYGTSGADPSGLPPADGITCASGLPNVFGQQGVFDPPYGQSSCTWYWQLINNGYSHAFNDVPNLDDGTTGVVTSVKLPSMAAPGPMRIVVLTRTLIHTQNQSPGNEYQTACCQTVEFSQMFTPPAGQISTIPLNLPVASGTLPAQPGQTSNSNVLAVEMLSADGTIPAAYSGIQDDTPVLRYPGQTQTTSEYEQYAQRSSYRLLAQYATGPPPAVPPAGTVSPKPATVAPPSPASGLKLGSRTAKVASTGAVTLGKVTNPPVRRATATLTTKLPTGRRHKRKTVTVARATVTVPSAKSRTLTVKLSAAGRSALRRHHRLKVTETIALVGTLGGKSTRSRSLTLTPAPKPKRKHRH